MTRTKLPEPGTCSNWVLTDVHIGWTTTADAAEIGRLFAENGIDYHPRSPFKDPLHAYAWYCGYTGQAATVAGWQRKYGTTDAVAAAQQ